MTQRTFSATGPGAAPHELDRVFRALGDPTRMAVLACLASGPRSISELAAPFDLSLPAFSKHLGVLERAGLIRREKRGRERICTLELERLREAHYWTGRVAEVWERRFDELDRYLRSEAPPSPLSADGGNGELTADG